MTSVLSDNEAACLDVAIGLLGQSDAYVATEPHLSRQYARQAYAMGRLSPRLREAIARERIRMIVQSSGQRCIMQALEAVTSSEGSRLRRVKNASLMISLFLAALFLHPTPVFELQDQSVELAARSINAPR